MQNLNPHFRCKNILLTYIQGKTKFIWLLTNFLFDSSVDCTHLQLIYHFFNIPNYLQPWSCVLSEEMDGFILPTYYQSIFVVLSIRFLPYIAEFIQK